MLWRFNPLNPDHAELQHACTGQVAVGSSFSFSPVQPGSELHNSAVSVSINHLNLPMSAGASHRKYIMQYFL